MGRLATSLAKGKVPPPPPSCGLSTADTACAIDEGVKTSYTLCEPPPCFFPALQTKEGTRKHGPSDGSAMKKISASAALVRPPKKRPTTDDQLMIMMAMMSHVGVVCACEMARCAYTNHSQLDLSPEKTFGPVLRMTLD